MPGCGADVLLALKVKNIDIVIREVNRLPPVKGTMRCSHARFLKVNDARRAREELSIITGTQWMPAVLPLVMVIKNRQEAVFRI